MAKRRARKDYFRCPHCGARVRKGAPACPKCGSDEETGWSENAQSWAADVPAGYGEEDDFDYDEFLAREFPGHGTRPARGSGLKWFWRVAAALLCLAIILALLRS